MSTWKGSVKTLQGLPLTMLILGGQLTGQLGQGSVPTLKDFARITSDNVDPRVGGQLTVNLERICKDLQGLPLRVNPGAPHTYRIISSVWVKL